MRKNVSTYLLTRQNDKLTRADEIADGAEAGGADAVTLVSVDCCIIADGCL